MLEERREYQSEFFFLSKVEPEPDLHTGSATSVADPDPDLWIRICILKFGSGSVWRDTNPDLDPGHIR